MVAASKRFTIHRAPMVLTVCLKRFDDFTGGKISKVCTQLERNLLFLAQGVSQSSGAFRRLLALRSLRSLARRGEFPREEKRVPCSGRAALAENSFLPPKPRHVALGSAELPSAPEMSFYASSP